MTKISTNSEFLQKVEKMADFLNGFVEHGSDQELFIASYLHGHFDLAVAKVEHLQQDTSSLLLLLQEGLNTQLQAAYDNKELSKSDQQEVSALVEQMF